MLILLPPSETKRDGGAGSPLALDRLSFPELHPVRREVVDAVVALSDDRDVAIRALKLGPKQAGEVDRNRAIPSTPTMRALERYTGVLYDALDAATLTDAEWAAAASSVASLDFLSLPPCGSMVFSESALASLPALSSVSSALPAFASNAANSSSLGAALFAAPCA